MSELDPVHIDNSHPCEPHFYELLAERDALKKEVEVQKAIKKRMTEGWAQERQVIKDQDAKIARLTQKLVNIRALPERSPKCSCFDIANKALRSHDAALEGREG